MGFNMVDAEIKSFLKTNDQETELIIKLFEIASSLEPKVQFQFRKNNFVGVGIPTEYLRFYFVRDNDCIKIKYKTRENLRDFDIKDSDKYQAQVKITDEFFKKFDMTLKSKPKKEKDYYRINMSRFDTLITLSKGVDPITGEILFTPSEELKQIIMNLAAFVLRKDDINSNSFQVRKNYDEIIEKTRAKKLEKPQYKKRGQKWTSEEDNVLLEEFNNTLPLDVIAKNHDRSVNAIRSRLLQFGKITETSQNADDIVF